MFDNVLNEEYSFQRKLLQLAMGKIPLPIINRTF